VPDSVPVVAESSVALGWEGDTTMIISRKRSFCGAISAACFPEEEPTCVRLEAHEGYEHDAAMVPTSVATDGEPIGHRGSKGSGAGDRVGCTCSCTDHNSAGWRQVGLPDCTQGQCIGLGARSTQSDGPSS
jgi:hypothetical protein